MTYDLTCLRAGKGKFGGTAFCARMNKKEIFKYILAQFPFRNCQYIYFIMKT
jgi:hypothetical protein